MDYFARTFYRTHAAAQTVCFINFRAEIDNMDCACGAGFFTDAAANAAYRALVFCVCAFVMVGTFYGNIICAVMYADNFLRADPHAGTAGYAFVFCYFRNAVAVQVYSIKFTVFDTGAAADAAVTARRCSLIFVTAAVAGNECSFIWKFLFYRHSQFFLSYGVFFMGRL